MLKEIKSLINNIIYDNKENWKFKLLSEWDSIVGSLSNKIRLEKIEDNILFIGVYEYQWMQELFIMQNTIIKSINSRLKNDYIKKVKFKIVDNNFKKFAKPTIYKNIEYKNAYNNIYIESIDNIKYIPLKNELQNYIRKCFYNNSFKV